MKKQFFANPILVISLLISIAIAATEVPLWISFFSVTMIGLKFFTERNWMRPLPGWIPPLLGFTVFTFVYLQYRTLWGQEPSTSLLLGLASVTILNFSSNRDHLFLVLLGFILIMVKSVFSIDLIWILPSMMSFLGLWISLISNSKISKFKFIFWHGIKSIPLALLLFFLFPRIVIFQSEKIQKKQAQVGMSEELNPGSIEEIIASNELAFRVEFTDQYLLGTNELYWRGAVLSRSYNLQWLKGYAEKSVKFRRQISGTKLQYKVILEPTLSKIIYVYDGATQIQDTVNAVETYDQNLFRKAYTEDEQFQYTAFSYVNSKIPATASEVNEGSDYLQTPKLPPRSEKWVKDTKAKFKTDNERLNALQDFFSNPKFVYTLKPGKYRDMDEFLFVRREGFCEHFAGSYATLARALGIPARVVLGYQGGSYNLAGNFWKVSQKDAHAWTEVAVNGNWTRIDPTQWVSPLRLSIGGEEFFSMSEEDQKLFSHTTKWKSENRFGNFWNAASLIFENLNYKWTLFLLNFDKQSQIEFLKDATSAWPTIMMTVILFMTLFFTLTKKRKIFKSSGLSPMNELMLFIEYKCRNLGIFINPSSPPLTTLDQLELLFEDEGNLNQRFRIEYERVVYNFATPSKSVASWKKEWIAYFKNRKLKQDTKIESGAPGL